MIAPSERACASRPEKRMEPSDSVDTSGSEKIDLLPSAEDVAIEDTSETAEDEEVR